MIPTRESIASAVRTARMPADGRVSLVYRPKSYPIVTYEYAIVRRSQGDPTKARAISDFVNWSIDHCTPEGLRVRYSTPARRRKAML